MARVETTRFAMFTRFTMRTTRATISRFMSKLADDCWRSAQLVVFFVVAAGTFAIPPGAPASAFTALQSFEARIVALHTAIIEKVAFLPDLAFEIKQTPPDPDKK